MASRMAIEIAGGEALSFTGDVTGTFYPTGARSVAMSIGAGKITAAMLAGVMQWGYVSADVPNNANPAAWADITGLAAFSVVSGGTYFFEAGLATFSNATSNISLFGVNGPATSLLTCSIQRPNVTAGTGNQASTVSAYDTGQTVSSVATSSLPVSIQGCATFTAGGTFAFRHKNTTAGVAITTAKGSWARLTRVA